MLIEFRSVETGSLLLPVVPVMSAFSKKKFVLNVSFVIIKGKNNCKFCKTQEK